MQYRLVKDGLDSGLLYVPDSQSFRSLEDDLITKKEWKNKEAILKNLEVPKVSTSAETLLGGLEKQLEALLTDVSQRTESGDNDVVVFTDKSGKTKWRLPYKGAGNKTNNPFFERLPPLHWLTYCLS